ncbi:MAG: hypothetical protein ACKPCI_04700 [Dolichospermum sp.]
MELQKALGLLEQAQELVKPILENAQDLIPEKEFKDNISTVLNLLNISAEDLADKDSLEELFRG